MVTGTKTVLAEYGLFLHSLKNPQDLALRILCMKMVSLLFVRDFIFFRILLRIRPLRNGQCQIPAHIEYIPSKFSYGIGDRKVR